MTILHAKQKRESTQAMIAQTKKDLLDMVKTLDASGLQDFWYAEPGPSNLGKPELHIVDGEFAVQKSYGLVYQDQWTLPEAEFVAEILPEFLLAYANKDADELDKWQRLVATVDRAVNDDVPF